MEGVLVLFFVVSGGMIFCASADYINSVVLKNTSFSSFIINETKKISFADY